MLDYESLNPAELLHYPPFLYASLWTVPPSAARKAVSCLSLPQQVARKAHPPIPGIILTRADGETVPVNFVEDHSPDVNIDVGSSFEAANLEMGDGWNATEDDRKALNSLISTSESRVATEFEAPRLPLRTVYHQGEHQGGVTKNRNGFGIGIDSPVPKLSEDESRLFVNKILNEQLQTSLDLVEAVSESLQSVDKGVAILPILGSDTRSGAPSDRDVEERTGEFEEMALPETQVDDAGRDDTDSLEEREEPDQDHEALGSISLSDDPAPDKTRTLPETMDETGSSAALQTPMKNVQLLVGDNSETEKMGGLQQTSSSVPQMGEYIRNWNLGNQSKDDGVVTLLVPFNTLADEQDTTFLVQLTMPVLPAVSDDGRVEEDDVLAELFSPSPTSKPIVNLPSLVTPREDMRLQEMDPTVLTALVEDVVTRSPPQIYSLITPVVVINMNINVEVEERPKSLGTEELGPGLPDVGHAPKTSNKNGEAYETVSPEDVSSPSIDNLDPASSSVVNCEPPYVNVRTLEVEAAFPPLGTTSEIGMPVPTTSPVAKNTNPSAATEIPETNEPQVEVLYETPVQGTLRGQEVSVSGKTVTGIDLPAVSESLKEPDVKVEVDSIPAEKSETATIILDGQSASLFGASVNELSSACGENLAGSVQDVLQKPEVSTSEPTSTGIDLPTVSESPNAPNTEDVVISKLAQESDYMTINFDCQHGNLFGALATEVSTSKDARVSALLDANEEANPLSMVKEVLWDHLSSTSKPALERTLSGSIHALPEPPTLMSKPAPERTLAGSMHAPLGCLPVSQSNTDISRSSVLYETSPFMTPSVLVMTAEEGKEIKNMITEATSKRKQGLAASIHAPRRTPKSEVQSSVSEPRDQSNRDRRRSLTNPMTSEAMPNWAAMPDVVEAFRMFKQASDGKTIRRVSSVVESSCRGPMLGVVGRKGIATKSQNNISVTANIQNRWMDGNGLLLVRSLVPSDPADFNLRAW